MARPTKKNPKGKQKSPKKTEEVIRELKNLLSIGCSIKEACISAGISYDTYYRWIKEDKKLSEELARAKQNIFKKVRMTIFENVGNPATAMWFAERRMPEFKNKVGVEVANPLIQEKKRINILINNLNLDEKDFEKEKLEGTLKKLAKEIIEQGAVDNEFILGEEDYSGAESEELEGKI
ncbi:MAG: Uncharacterized protein XE08_0357 [Parcubacteria bacterium 32_520]|nr:MAG: Uncharacterized protein XE08_0357 [Parcubacteria bacterium 32_520]